ncbi:hypothetical protein ABEF95_015525 [Exophiala dermatitidis]
MTAAVTRFLRVRPAARLVRPCCRSTRLNRVPPFARSLTTTTKGDTQNATNIAKDNPQSGSAQEQGVKSSRATEGGIQDSASVAKPTSQVGTGGGQDEEGSAPGTKDPNKPAGQKRAEVQKEGMKPLDAADK